MKLCIQTVMDFAPKFIQNQPQWITNRLITKLESCCTINYNYNINIDFDKISHMNTKEVVILHISDLHFGMPDKSNPKHLRDRESILRSFIDSLAQFNDEEIAWKPDILAITGDIGYRGKKSDYIKAEKYIKEIIDACENITENDIVICPGNHDVLLPDYSAILPRRDSEDLPNGCPSLALDEIEKISSRFSNFSDFLIRNNFSNLQHDQFKARSKQQKRAGVLFGFKQIKGVNFLILNSEWDFYGPLPKDDYDYTGILRTGPDLLADSLNQMKKSESFSPVFALMHHPPTFLWRVEQGGYIDDDPQSVRDLLDINVHALLHGHTHGRLDNSRLKKHTEVYSCSSLHANDVNFYGAWLIKVSWNEEEIAFFPVEYKWQKRTAPADRFPYGRWVIDHDTRPQQRCFPREDPAADMMAFSEVFKSANELISLFKQSDDETERNRIREMIGKILETVKKYLRGLSSKFEDEFNKLVKWLSTTNEKEENYPIIEDRKGKRKALTDSPLEDESDGNDKKGTK